MVEGPFLVGILLIVIVFIVVTTTKFKLHPFIALLLAAFLTAFLAGMPLLEIEATIRAGFGGILGYIGIVIVLGTIIGSILEKSGAAIKMADTVLKWIGETRPNLAMTFVGYIVSIPVFCDSGYVILSSLKRSLAKKTNQSAVAMSIALATGLFATHTLVPPTPGPIAAAGNLGITDGLGLVIGVGAILALIAALSGYLWSQFIGSRLTSGEDTEPDDTDYSAERARYGELPTAWAAFAPIVVPIVLICLGSIATYPTHPLGEGGLFTMLSFLGKPVVALLIGLFFAFRLFPALNEETLSGWIGDGVKASGTIIMVTGAGGAFGKVISATPIGAYLGESLSTMGVGIFLPFIIAAALKTAQGSSTVALVTTSALVAPLLPDLGLATEMGTVLTVMAIGAGAMTVSHANDSFFWVVSQFSKMDVATAYRAVTTATLIQGLVTITLVWILSLVLL